MLPPMEGDAGETPVPSSGSRVEAARFRGRHIHAMLTMLLGDMPLATTVAEVISAALEWKKAPARHVYINPDVKW